MESRTARSRTAVARATQRRANRRRKLRARSRPVAAGLHRQPLVRSDRPTAGSISSLEHDGPRRDFDHRLPRAARQSSSAISPMLGTSNQRWFETLMASASFELVPRASTDIRDIDRARAAGEPSIRSPEWMPMTSSPPGGGAPPAIAAVDLGASLQLRPYRFPHRRLPDACDGRAGIRRRLAGPSRSRPEVARLPAAMFQRHPSIAAAIRPSSP